MSSPNIIRNSAKCVHCGEEIESKYRHHFNVHFCSVIPKVSQHWAVIDGKEVLVESPGETTWNFAVDGGKSYIRRIGHGFTDTSLFEETT